MLAVKLSLVGELVCIISGVAGGISGISVYDVYMNFYFPEMGNNKFFTTDANTLKIAYD
jgi:hypothetical protein